MTEADNTYAYMSATTSGWEGYVSDSIYRGDGYDKKDISYELSLDCKLSPDFKGNSVSVGVFFYDDDNFQAFKEVATITPSKTGEWEKKTICLHSKLMERVKRDFDHDSFKFIVRVAKNGDAPAGTVYLDNVKITGYKPSEDVIDAQMYADKYASWYILGDTVTFKLNFPNRLSDAETIEGIVYNMEGDVVHTSTISKDTVIDAGWTWIPDTNGYYEVGFNASLSDGTKVPLVNTRTLSADSSENYATYNRDRTSVYVAATQTKAMADRNPSLFYSSTEFNNDTIEYDANHNKLADLVGFSGARLISINWGDAPNGNGGTSKGVESVKGTYDWAQVDETIDSCIGMNKVIACVMRTPKWAVSDDRIVNSKGEAVDPYDVTVGGNYLYNNFAPDNITDWENFIRALVTRYKDSVDIWEIWNEPMLVNSAFWYDTPENYIRLLKSAYTVIKDVDPDAIVSTAGMGNQEKYLDFLNAMLEIDETVLDYCDYWAVHGDYDMISDVKDIIASTGHDPIPWINTEGYMSAKRSGSKLTDTQIASESILNYLMNYKQGADIVTYFSIFNIGSEADSGETDYSMFRYTPYIEPRKSAAVLYTLFDLMESNFAYDSEYQMGNSLFSKGLMAVLSTNGTGNVLSVWSPNGQEADFHSGIVNAMTENSKIILMDGRETTNQKIPAGQVVHITNVNKTVLNSYKKTDKALSTEYAYPRFECKAGSSWEDLFPWLQ